MNSDLSFVCASLSNNKNTPSLFDDILQQYLGAILYTQSYISRISDDPFFSEFIRFSLIPLLRRPLNSPNEGKISPICQSCLSFLTNLGAQNPRALDIIAASSPLDELIPLFFRNLITNQHENSKKSSKSNCSYSKSFKEESDENETKIDSGSNDNKSQKSGVSFYSFYGDNIGDTAGGSTFYVEYVDFFLPIFKFLAVVSTSPRICVNFAETLHILFNIIFNVLKVNEITKWALAVIAGFVRNSGVAASLIRSLPIFLKLREEIAQFLTSEDSDMMISALSILVTLFPHDVNAETSLKIAVTNFTSPNYNNFPVTYFLSSWIISDMCEICPICTEDVQLLINIASHNMSSDLCSPKTISDTNDEKNKTSNEILNIEIEVEDKSNKNKIDNIKTYLLYNTLIESEPMHDKLRDIISENVFDFLNAILNADEGFVALAGNQLINILFHPPHGSGTPFKATKNVKIPFISALKQLLSRGSSLLSIEKKETAASLLFFMSEMQETMTFVCDVLKKCEEKLFLDFQRQIENNNSFFALQYFLFLSSVSTFFANWKTRLSELVIETQFPALLLHVLTESKNRVSISSSLYAVQIILSNIRFNELFICYKGETELNKIKTENPDKHANLKETDVISSSHSIACPMFDSLVSGFLCLNTKRNEEKQKILFELNEKDKKHELAINEMKVEFELTQNELLSEVSSLQSQLLESRSSSETIDSLNNEKISQLQNKVKNLSLTNKKLENENSRIKSDISSGNSCSSRFDNDSTTSHGSQIRSKSTTLKNCLNKNKESKITNENGNLNKIKNGVPDNNSRCNVNNFSGASNVQSSVINQRLENELRIVRKELDKTKTSLANQQKANTKLRELLEMNKKQITSYKSKVEKMDRIDNNQKVQINRLRIEKDQMRQEILNKEMNNKKLFKQIRKSAKSADSSPNHQNISLAEKQEDKVTDDSFNQTQNSVKLEQLESENMIERISRLENQIFEYQMLFKLIHKTTNREYNLPPSVVSFLNVDDSLVTKEM